MQDLLSPLCWAFLLIHHSPLPQGPCPTVLQWSLLKMAIEKFRQCRHRFARFRQVRVLPEEVPHPFKDVEVCFDARIAQLAMEKHRLAQAHIACAGEQKCGRIAFGDVAIQRCGGRLIRLALGWLPVRRMAGGKRGRERGIQAVHRIARVTAVPAPRTAI